MKHLFLLLILIASVPVVAQTGKRPASSRAKVVEPSQSQSTIHKALSDSIRAQRVFVQKVAKELQLEDSLRNAEIAYEISALKAAVEVNQQAVVSLQGKMNQGPSLSGGPAPFAPKGSVSIGPSLLATLGWPSTHARGYGGGVSLVYAMGRKFSVGLSADYNEGQASNPRFTYVSTMLSVKPDFRFYFKKALSGFFVAPSMLLASYQVRNSEYQNLGGVTVYTLGNVKNEFGLGAGLSIGVSAPLSNRLYLELATGGNLNFLDSDTGFLSGALRIGYAF